MTKLGDLRHITAGLSEQEYSITFDTNYPTTGGESLGFGSATNFISKVRYMKITRDFQDTNQPWVVKFVPGTSDGATNSKIQLFFEALASSTNSRMTKYECSTTTDVSAVKGRAIFGGF